jgi:hypothetical protein
VVVSSVLQLLLTADIVPSSLIVTGLIGFPRLTLRSKKLWLLVHRRNLPTDRPPLVDEF